MYERLETDEEFTKRLAAIKKTEEKEKATYERLKKKYG